MSEREPLRITRRTAIKWGALAAAAPALSGLPLDAFASGDSVVLRWNEAALQGVRDSKLGPPMVARALAIVHTASMTPGPPTTITRWGPDSAALSAGQPESA